MDTHQLCGFVTPVSGRFVSICVIKTKAGEKNQFFISIQNNVPTWKLVYPDLHKYI